MFVCSFVFYCFVCQAFNSKIVSFNLVPTVGFFVGRKTLFIICIYRRLILMKDYNGGNVLMKAHSHFMRRNNTSACFMLQNSSRVLAI